jgi:signal transduction histidine kinase
LTENHLNRKTHPPERKHGNKRYSKLSEKLVNNETRNVGNDEEALRSAFAAYPNPPEVTDLSGKIIDSARARVLQQLKEYSKHLEEKVKERTRELRGVQRQLLKSERLAAIGELAGMVGHDLRNPLTSIAGATYYLRKNYGTKMDRKGKEMLEIVEKDIECSNKIINDLLEYSEEIKLQVSETNPKQILKEALSLVPVPNDIQVVSDIQSRPRINVDVERMQRAFINIIKNAFDAMPDGGRLTITSKEATNGVMFTFSDTGVGMSKKTLRKIWTPLFTTKAKGMGFGLPICKRILEAHRGKISVESEVDKGTTFTLTIPTKQKPAKRFEGIWVNEPESLLRAQVTP